MPQDALDFAIKLVGLAFSTAPIWLLSEAIDTHVVTAGVTGGACFLSCVVVYRQSSVAQVQDFTSTIGGCSSTLPCQLVKTLTSVSSDSAISRGWRQSSMLTTCSGHLAEHFCTVEGYA